MNRKGFELSINTLVVIILGLIIIGGGMVLLGKVVSKSGELVDQVSAQQAERLSAQLREGKLVAIYPANLDLSPGEIGKVGLGLRNAHKQSESFVIDVRRKDASGKELNPSWITLQQPAALESQGETTLPLLVAIPKDASPGTYTFFVSVRDASGAPYDSVRYFTIVVA